jgi:diguanylate cyclase (GGDEF)-like protein/PAS domain S-box-containing protein
MSVQQAVSHEAGIEPAAPVVTQDPLRSSGLTQLQPAVLVVNDREAQRVAIRAMLAPLNLTIVEADSGPAALRAVLHETFALILMDVQMPTMSGYETASLIRQHRQAHETPIIFVTAFAREDTETLTAYASGAVDFIFTPVVPEVLRAKVSVFVNLYTQSREMRLQSDQLRSRSEELQSSLAAISALNVALRGSQASTQAVLDNVADGVLTVGDTGLVESSNRSAQSLFGFAESDLIGQPFSLLIAPETTEGTSEPAAAHRGSQIETGSDSRALQTLGCRSDGSTFAMEVEHGELTLGDRTVTISFVRDVSARRAYTEGLEHQALHDPLTGLANRVLFDTHLQHALVIGRQTGQSGAVLVIDLDGFKRVNDTLGHAHGDMLLKQVADRLVGALRKTDTVARLGGDEFAILLGGSTNLAAASAIAWKLRQTCAAGFRLADGSIRVSASIGIALFPEHGTTTAELLRRADSAMYVAKRAGDGHAVCDTADDQQMTDGLALISDLRECVARDQLVLRYQPRIDLATNAISGAEAQLRWQHPIHGLLRPRQFLPEAERIELLGPITRWMIDQALQQEARWRERGIERTIAVNIASRSLGPGSALPDLIAELTQTWLTPAGRLILQLTEAALLAAAPDVLRQLHESGQRLSIVHYGTGHSSLACLQRLPVDEVKIDRTFITNLAADGDDAVIVRLSIELAHSLGLVVVADGVDDQAALDLLIAYGCDSAQGELLGHAGGFSDLIAPQTDSPHAEAVTSPAGLR